MNMKKIKTILLEILLGAVMYFVVGTAYYHCTGDDSNSGMTAVRATIIYLMLLTGARYVATWRGIRANGGTKGKAYKRVGMAVYTLLLIAAWSVGVFFFLETEALDDALISIFCISVLSAVICAMIWLINYLDFKVKDKAQKRVEEKRKSFDRLYGGSDMLRYDYKLITVYCTNIVAEAKEIFGEDFELLEFLGSDQSFYERAETLRGKYGFIPVSNSIEDIKAAINAFCEKMGYGISISDEELASICEQYDNDSVKARRRDGVFTYPHDMALLSELLRGKGYELYKLSCEGCAECSDYYEDDDEDYDEDGEPIEKPFDPNRRPRESCGKYEEDDSTFCCVFLTVAKLRS